MALVNPPYIPPADNTRRRKAADISHLLDVYSNPLNVNFEQAKYGDNYTRKTNDKEGVSLWDELKGSKINPKNWGVPDYSDKEDFDNAFSSARKAGEKEFMWNNKRYSTAMEGENRPESSFPRSRAFRENVYKAISPSSYPIDQFGRALKNIISGNYRMESIDMIEKTRDKIVPKVYNQASEDLHNMTGGYNVSDEDLWRHYLGLNQIDNLVIESKYKPTKSKDKNAKYYTLTELDDLHFENPSIEFKDEILGCAKELNEFPVQKKTKITGIANATIDKGEDERGKYYSLYDIYDFNIPFEEQIGKPFEIYDRVYYKNYGGKNKKRMYYNDKELSELNVNKKNFDTKALQRELSNRGYKLPESTKKDGSFDGIWGGETKAALLNYQLKKRQQ